MNNVFISYRRTDSKDATRRMHDWLSLHFVREDLFFIDIDSIYAASDFPKKLQDAIAESRLMLAIIGPRWLEELGRRSASNEIDHVRLEIEGANRAGIEILPVLLDETRIPNARDLPESLKFLPNKQSLTVHSEANFATDMKRLAKSISAISNEPYTDLSLVVGNSRRAGLSWFDVTFGTYAQEKLVEEANELTLVFNDGRNWVDMRRDLLTRWLKRSGRSLRFVCLHPDSPFLSILIKKNTKPLETQRYEILRGFVAVHNAAADAGNPSALRIYGHYTFNPITLLMSEKKALLSHYLYTEQAELLSFEYSNADVGSYYHILRRDVDRLIQNGDITKEISDQEIRSYEAELRRR
jgi:hypothetical protein